MDKNKNMEKNNTDKNTTKKTEKVEFGNDMEMGSNTQKNCGNK